MNIFRACALHTIVMCAYVSASVSASEPIADFSQGNYEIKISEELIESSASAKLTKRLCLLLHSYNNEAVERKDDGKKRVFDKEEKLAKDYLEYVIISSIEEKVRGTRSHLTVTLVMANQAQGWGLETTKPIVESLRVLTNKHKGSWQAIIAPLLWSNLALRGNYGKQDVYKEVIAEIERSIPPNELANGGPSKTVLEYLGYKTPLRATYLLQLASLKEQLLQIPDSDNDDESEKNVISAYRRVIDEFPKSPHALAAKGRIEKLPIIMKMLRND